MKIKVTEKDCTCGIQGFYDNVAIALGKDSSNLVYECTKINVSTRVQELIFAFYESAWAQNFEMGMWWCCFGPKVDENLEAFEVEIFDGFCAEEEM